jgi:histidine triad (HIT) family protein
MSQSIFSLLISKKIPSYQIFEDEHTYAFLAKDAINLGHTLIVPKVEIDYFVDVPEPYYSAVFKNAKIISRAIHKATGCKRVGTIIAGWDVPHFHYHLIPMFDYYDLDPRKGTERTHEESQLIMSKIVSELNRD